MVSSSRKKKKKSTEACKKKRKSSTEQVCVVLNNQFLMRSKWYKNRLPSKYLSKNISEATESVREHPYHVKYKDTRFIHQDDKDLFGSIKGLVHVPVSKRGCIPCAKCEVRICVYSTSRAPRWSNMFLHFRRVHDCKSWEKMREMFPADFDIPPEEKPSKDTCLKVKRERDRLLHFVRDKAVMDALRRRLGSEFQCAESVALVHLNDLCTQIQNKCIPAEKKEALKVFDKDAGLLLRLAGKKSIATNLRYYASQIVRY